ncbi:hypothetical protein QYF61_016031 [Mycteria americana]|uniref:Uncharacterized protein n=1 Tax=Mycteria americana TaxID=33587 RepID=A0AAN7MRB1_MYCAM|nr:hypothetical protein QYF61_016031 [Mycteria americana]
MMCQLSVVESKSATFPTEKPRHLLDDSVLESHSPARSHALNSLFTNGLSIDSSESSEFSEELPSGLERDAVRKAKARLELNLARDTKNNKGGFYRYISQKRKVKETVPPMNTTGKLVTTGEEKAEVLNFFCLSLHWQPFFPHLSSG